uniref:HepB protein n=1 Tax=Cylindrotheca fusiformis TaxID=2853 RepID=O22016_CYLFU|nr:HepB protein [Cylindrotheca fusiformis]
MEIISLRLVLLLQLLCLGCAAGEAVENRELNQEDEVWYSRMYQEVNSLTPPPTPPPTRPPTRPPTPPPTRPPTPSPTPPPTPSPNTPPTPPPTPPPTRPPTPPPTPAPSRPTDLEPSSQPSECSDVIEKCPIDECFLPYTDPSRPLDCTDPSINRPDCDILPTPQDIGCPSCCAFECRPDNPMFTPSPDGSPPICSPTMMPSPQPSGVVDSPTPEPSSAPSDCAEVIEQCPIDECFLPYGDSSRPKDCTDPDINRPDCDVLPTPQNIGCPACCAFECRPDNPMFTPSPDGSPPICSPTMMPSPEPSSQPSECADVIEQCPIDACFLPKTDPSRPLDCTDPQVDRPDCDVLPTPINIGCPNCCAFECSPDNPMFTPSPDGSPPICSPTMMPSPLPSGGGNPLTPQPSSQPSECSDILEQCPHDTCFLPFDDPLRPPSCTDPSVDRPDCDVLPTPANIGCPTCCPSECRPDNPMFSPSPDGSPPICSPTMMPSPLPSDENNPLTPEPSAAPSPVLSLSPSSAPSPTDGPECGLDLKFDTLCQFSCRFDICVERPYRMQMRYNGGGCQGTNFRRCPIRDPDPTPDLPNPDPCTCTKEELPCEDWNNNNECEDFSVTGAVCNSIDQFCEDQSNRDPIPGCGPPPADVQHTVYIEAFGKEDELYFSGPVAVNTTWEAVTEGEEVDANTDIFTYEWIEGEGKGRMMQHVVFHSSCSQELFLTDQFGSQQLLEFDSFCDVSCSDGGCVEVTEDGLTFGRRRISLFADSGGPQLDFSLEVTSPGENVELEQVLGLVSVDDSSTPTQFFNFSNVIGTIVPPPVVLNPDDLKVAVNQNYTIGAIVTGFLEADPSLPCQQVAQGTLICEKVDDLDCECPPCDGGGDGKKPKKKNTRI